MRAPLSFVVFSATSFTNLHESFSCRRVNSRHSWQKPARHAAANHRLDPVAPSTAPRTCPEHVEGAGVGVAPVLLITGRRATDVRHGMLVRAILVVEIRARALEIDDVAGVAVGVIALAASAVVKWVLSWTSPPVDVLQLTLQ